MAGEIWTADEETRFREIMAANSDGFLQDRIKFAADQLNRSYNGTYGKWRAICRSGPPRAESTPEITEQLKDFARSAGVASQPQAPQVIPGWVDEESIADTWAAAERNNERQIEKARTRSIFSVNFPANDPIAIACISDQHIAPGTPVDMARMRADAEYVRDTPNFYAALVGDGVDNHIKHQAAIVAARSTPDDQWKLFDYYLGIFAPKILALCSGNHCAWTNERAGIDMVQWLATNNKICYSPASFMIDIEVGGFVYNFVARHQYRLNSSFNQTHAVKQLLRLGETEFDIGVIGHHHEHAMEASVYRGKEVWACRPGSYQITSAYSRQYGYNSAYPTCPTFVLIPGRRDITGFSCMRKAAIYMRSLMR